MGEGKICQAVSSTIWKKRVFAYQFMTSGRVMLLNMAKTLDTDWYNLAKEVRNSKFQPVLRISGELTFGKRLCPYDVVASVSFSIAS
jgi:hypothetical protein